MMFCGLCAFVAHFCFVASRRSQAVPQAGNYSGFVVLRAEPKSEKELHMLSEKALARVSLSADYWQEPTTTDAPVVMMFERRLASRAQSYLNALDIVYETMISDVQAAIDATKPKAGAQASSTFALNEYHTFKDITQWIQRSAASFSDVQEIHIGKTYEGRMVKGLSINSGAGKPIIFMLCGIHSREWASTASCIYVADQLMRGKAGSIAKGFEWHIVPVGNADGYEFTWSKNRLWRKTRRPNGWFCKGVDPNRNWDFKHCQELKDKLCTDSYCGPEPFSESETLNVANYVKGLGGRVKAFLDVHAFSQMWMWPWAYTRDAPDDAADMIKCGTAGVSALEAVHGTKWKRGGIARTIYKVGGSSVDWTYGVLGIKYSYALELRDTGRSGFLLPADQIIPSGTELLAGLEAMAACIKR